MKRLPVEEVEARLPGTEVEVVLLLGAEALFPGRPRGRRGPRVLGREPPDGAHRRLGDNKSRAEAGAGVDLVHYLF